MAKYRAEITVEFDTEDLENWPEAEELDPYEALEADLYNLNLGTAWINQMYCNDRPMILTLSEDE